MTNELTVEEELYALIYEGNNSSKLETCLKSLPNLDQVLFYVYQRGDQHFSLLMLAAVYGKDDMVRTILSLSPNVTKLAEIRGIVYGINGSLVKNATALWCACDRMHYQVARTLIEMGGAKVDHGPRYPLLIDSIIDGRIDTVQFLVENSYADVNAKSMNGNYKLNTLIMAVIYGHQYIVSFLIGRGADINYSAPTSNNTPLCYAAIKGHIEIVKLLCSSGACLSTKNKSGLTAMMLAAKYNHMNIVDYLIDQNSDTEASIKQLELIACSFITATTQYIIIQQNQFERMLDLMRKVFELREKYHVNKIIAEPIEAYCYHQECQTIEQLNHIQYDNERLCLEALMIRERILVPEKDETLFKPLLIRGDKLIQRKQYQSCLHLWKHTFYLYQNMNLETGLHRFIWLFCKMFTDNINVTAQQFLYASYLTFEPSQRVARDDYIKNSVCLLAIAVKILEQPTTTNDECQLIYQWISELCRQQQYILQKQTLLHLCVDVQTYDDINYRPHDIKPIIHFPNIAIAKLLLVRFHQWIDINSAESIDGNTALHVVCRNGTSDSLKIAELLINLGAHIDCMNFEKKTPLDLAKSNELRTFLTSIQIPTRLKCICARLILEKNLNYESIWPKNTEMNKFLYLHGGLVK